MKATRLFKLDGAKASIVVRLWMLAWLPLEMWTVLRRLRRVSMDVGEVAPPTHMHLQHRLAIMSTAN